MFILFRLLYILYRLQSGVNTAVRTPDFDILFRAFRPQCCGKQSVLESYSYCVFSSHKSLLLAAALLLRQLAQNCLHRDGTDRNIYDGPNCARGTPAPTGSALFGLQRWERH